MKKKIEKINVPEQRNVPEVSPSGGDLEGAKGAIDINCDMGEGIGRDEMIMPFISSANIACGYHAGNETIIKANDRISAKEQCGHWRTPFVF